MQNVVEAPHLRNREFVFSDREDAGKRLGKLLGEKTGADGLILAIPSGGVPVAAALQSYVVWPMELLLVRKVQIPHNPEAGFGAVNLDGDRVFNQRLLGTLHLSWEVIETQVNSALRTIKQRNTVFRCDKPFPDITGKNIILVDDGLASGYTMHAALQFIRKRHPADIIVAVPTGTLETTADIAREVDQVYCLNIREGYPFAVASAYMNWHDLTDKEVLSLLERAPCL